MPLLSLTTAIFQPASFVLRISSYLRSALSITVSVTKSNSPSIHIRCSASPYSGSGSPFVDIHHRSPLSRPHPESGRSTAAVDSGGNDSGTRHAAFRSGSRHGRRPVTVTLTPGRDSWVVVSAVVARVGQMGAVTGETWCGAGNSGAGWKAW